MAKNKRSSTKGLEKQLQDQGHKMKPKIQNTRPNRTMKSENTRELTDRRGFVECGTAFDCKE